MEKIVEQGLLFDFYGELLTEHQKKIYQDAVFGDMSLSELASEYGVSRQGIHDLLKRCNASLMEYEEKLHLVTKFMSIREKIREIDTLATESELSREVMSEKIRQLSGEILEEL